MSAFAELSSPDASAATAISLPAAKSFDALDWSSLDSEVLGLFGSFDSADVPKGRGRLDIGDIRETAERIAIRSLTGKVSPPAVTPIDVHRRITSGFPGMSMLVSGSLFLDSVHDVTRFFRISDKTFRSRLVHSLGPEESELAMRSTRLMFATARVLGDFDAAREYVRTKNFALGGATPAELIQTSEGERMVLNELQAHADSGPL